MSLSFSSFETGVDLRDFPALSARVESAAEPLGWRKRLGGKRSFSHKAIPTEGGPGVDPALVGRRHELLLGKHSNACAVMSAYAELGLPLAPQETARLLAWVRQFADDYKRPPLASELAWLRAQPAA
jgi:homocitrate synthase NifV